MPGDGLTAIVVDSNATRRERVEAQLRDAHFEIAGDNAVGERLVLFAADAPDTEAGIRHRSGHGGHVIAYADATETWPISQRCRLLLAGAREIVDAAPPSIADAVQRFSFEAGRRSTVERALQQALSDIDAVAESPKMRDIFRRVLHVSVLSDLPVLITGETGTGKQLIAEALHRFDRKRRDGPFVALNCGAITNTLVEAELFGHRRGAFTGADRDRKGLVRAADGGVLFLDELGELEAGIQVKLLRVLQEQRVLAVGDDREATVSVRVVAATNRDLSTAVRAGTFREDLFQRLNVITIHLPPLRERREDIAALVRYFLRKHRHISNGVALDAAPDFLEALAMLELPGNAREVENLVRSALVHATGDAVMLRDLPRDVWSHLSAESVAREHMTPGPAAFAGTMLDAHPGNLASALDACERALVREALARSSGNQARTARMLGVTARCVYNKLRKHRLIA